MFDAITEVDTPAKAMTLRPYQQEAADSVLREWEQRDRTLLVMPTGCHDPEQLILMYNGELRKAKDIYEGDMLMGPDSLPRTVLVRHEGESDMKKVIPVKGSPFVVTKDHKLTLVRTTEKRDPSCACHMRGGELVDISVEEWEGWTKWKKHIHKLCRTGIDFSPDATVLPIDPYVLGLLLGDGSFASHLSFTSMEDACKLAVELELDKFNIGLKDSGADCGLATCWLFKSKLRTHTKSKFRRILKSLGLDKTNSSTKLIPNIYKTSSRQDRERLLAGLLDSDGAYNCNGYDYITKSEALANDVAFVSRSLGLAAYVKPCKKNSQNGTKGSYHRVSISGHTSTIPCLVERKKARVRRQKKNVLRTGFSVEDAGVGAYVGFTVDGDNRYLMGDFTISHNCGKTIVFSGITSSVVAQGGRVLILAHREELLMQAADKLHASMGLKCAVEKAKDTCLGSWYRVVVGSVQTLMRQDRLDQFEPSHFTHIIVDEAHHALANSYQAVLNYFDAKVLGVTATPDRGDMRELGEYFESLAYEYLLPQAIKDGYLCKIMAKTLPLKIDISNAGMSQGDYKLGDLGDSLEPYLEQIVAEMKVHCADRKSVVFLPLIRTSQAMCDMLIAAGFRAAEVNGKSKDRAEVLADFDAGKYDVLCNSMLLTEGWDCPSVDCIVCLRPTKIRSLYCLDEQTEVLTENGWKKSVAVGEKVAAFDPKTSEVAFKNAVATVRRSLKQDEHFCSISGPSVDIRVTDKHRLLYDNKRRKGWKFKSAKEVSELSSGTLIPAAGFMQAPGVPLTDDELRFIGWVMTDGTINKHNNAISITQGDHQPWLEEIERVIVSCGFKFNRFVRVRDSQFKSNSNCIVWTISKGKPRGRDKHLRGWGALEPWLSKDYSQKLLDCTREQFKVLLEALGDGAKQDGCSWTRRSYHIASGNQLFAERLQIAAILNGHRSSLTSRPNPVNLLYTIHIKDQGWSNVGSTYDSRPRWIQEAHSEEMCWCVENEWGTLVTRRNGKIAIVGNCQIIGRGTRPSPGKENLLILDFLWNTSKHSLCRPANLIATQPEVAEKMTAMMEEAAEDDAEQLMLFDIESLEDAAEEALVHERELSLAKALREQRKKKARLVDPLQYEMSISAEDLADYRPSFGWEMAPPSKAQTERLEKAGINPEGIQSAGHASLLIDRLEKRRDSGMSTPRQIRTLERYGVEHVGNISFEQASKMIDRIAANGWRKPNGMTIPAPKPPTTLGLK